MASMAGAHPQLLRAVMEINNDMRRLHIFGEARAPVADPGLQELRADATIEAHSVCHLLHVCARRSHTVAISLMKLILVARNTLEAYLIISAVRMSVYASDTRSAGRAWMMLYTVA
jgi:hypothetical protein